MTGKINGSCLNHGDPCNTQPPQFQYLPKYKSNQIICGNGLTAVVCGWTPRLAVAKALQKEDFAALGQLYSPRRGINFLIRNLLLNPHVRFLVALNATKEDQNAGGCRCLIDFWHQGCRPGFSEAQKPVWIINSEVVGYIDFEIPLEALDNLRSNVQAFEAHSLQEAIAIIKSLPKQTQPWGIPQEFPITDYEAPLLPGRQIGHTIQAPTIAETWIQILHRIRTFGKLRLTSYGGKWQELITLTAVVTNEPEDFYVPDYLPIDRPFIQEYSEHLLKPQSKGNVRYTYGDRLRTYFGQDQIDAAIAALKKNPYSSRVVLNLWDSQSDLSAAEPPCLNHIWIAVSDGKLILVGTFRSNDMFSAWPANAMQLRTLQRFIQVNAVPHIALGSLVTVSHSAHIYDDCFETADAIIRQHYPPKATFSDPAGSFVIGINQGEIVVELISPGAGETLRRYQGKSARAIYKQIASDRPDLETEHALYLGTELQKAEIALKLKVPYEQDKPLNFG